MRSRGFRERCGGKLRNGMHDRGQSETTFEKSTARVLHGRASRREHSKKRGEGIERHVAESGRAEFLDQPIQRVKLCQDPVAAQPKSLCY